MTRVPPEFRAAGGGVAQDSPTGERVRGPGRGALLALLGRMNDDQIELLTRIASVLDRQSMNMCESLADAPRLVLAFDKARAQGPHLSIPTLRGRPR